MITLSSQELFHNSTNELSLFLLNLLPCVLLGLAQDSRTQFYDTMDFIFDETKEEMAYFWERPSPTYTRPVAERGTLWGELVKFDLRLIWRTRRILDSVGVGFFLRQFISNNPYKDISLITWTASIFGWWEFGIKMVWLTIINLFLVILLRAIVQAPRPFEFDRSLRPMADRQQSSYGCPTIESYMSVITFGYLAHMFGQGNMVWHLITFGMSFFIGLTRIYAGSRFIHQIVVSWLLGSILLWVYIYKIQIYIPDWGEDIKNKKLRIGLMIPWAFAFLAYICLALEDNSSTLFRIPNNEFIRVMTHIMDTGAAADEEEEIKRRNKLKRNKRREEQNGDNDDDDDDDDDPLLRRYRDQNASTQERKKRQLAKRKDSFYFLQHSIRNKDIERVGVRAKWGRYDDDDDDAFHDVQSDNRD